MSFSEKLTSSSNSSSDSSLIHLSTGSVPLANTFEEDVVTSSACRKDGTNRNPTHTAAMVITVEIISFV